MSVRRRPIRNQAPSWDEVVSDFHTLYDVVHSGCWEWRGSMYGDGYGRFSLEPGRYIGAHRASLAVHGVALDGDLVVDHLCRNTLCVNPAHLELVTVTENILRGVSPWAAKARQTHCKWGHEFTPENTYIPPGRPSTRVCRPCSLRRRRELHAKATCAALRTAVAA
jgi:hypothetical protein